MMTTPAQYLRQLAEIDPTSLNVDEKTPAAAQAGLERLLEVQQHVQEIDRAIALDIQMLRSRYLARYSSLSSGSTGRIQESNKRKVGSQARGEDLERLNTERDTKMAPLVEVKKEADELLAKIAVVRQSLEKIIQAA
jgi:hypothetical protein